MRVPGRRSRRRARAECRWPSGCAAPGSPPQPPSITTSASDARAPSLRAIMGRSASVAELPKWARALLEPRAWGGSGSWTTRRPAGAAGHLRAGSAGALVSAVDHKRKDVPPERLARVRWLRARPRAALTVDHYEEDWSRLAWVQAIGEGLDPRRATPRTRSPRSPSATSSTAITRPPGRSCRWHPTDRLVDEHRPLRARRRRAGGHRAARSALAAVAIRRRSLPDWTGAPARLAEVVIGLAAADRDPRAARRRSGCSRSPRS